MMTVEIALARLSLDRFDAVALEQLYILSSQQVRKIVRRWFDDDSTFDYALSWAMARVAANARQFLPEHQTPEAFVVETVKSECKRLHEVMRRTKGSLRSDLIHRRNDVHFEVFKEQPGGSLHKVGVARDFYGAIWHAELAALTAPGKYVLLNRHTGEKDELNLVESNHMVEASPRRVI